MSAQSTISPSKTISETPMARSVPHKLNVDDWLTLWRRCWAQIRTWKLPPRWDRRDWAEEAEAQGALAACQSYQEFDANRGVPLTAFLYQRVLSAVWTLHRRELRFSYRSRELEHASEPASPTIKFHQIELSDYVTLLSETDRDMIFQIYWKGQTEQAVSTNLGITQQKVNKKKNAILRDLLKLMKVESLTQ